MSGIENENVSLSVDESLCSVEDVSCNADSCAAEESALAVTGGVGVLYGLFDVLDSDKTLEVAAFVNDGELFDLVGTEDILSLCKSSADRSSDEVFLCHNL